VATTAPYGSWSSPVSAELVAAGGVSLDEVRVEAGAVHWVEGRPLEGGRQVICRAEPGTDQEPADLTPEGFNARTRVHEYGGGAYAVHGDSVFFSNFADQRVYRQDAGAARPVPITPEPPAPAADRYADLCPTPDGRRLVGVRERHHDGKVDNELVMLAADGGGVGGQPVVLAAGRDFYASPRISPDGRRLAWLEWDHPNMPWDGTELRLAELGGDGLAGDPVTVAGGPEESVFQPEWSPDGVLHLTSDRTGWWNLYRLADGPGGALEALAPATEEFGQPQWVFGMATYAFLPGGRIACIHGRGPLQRLGVLEADGTLTDLELPFASFSPPQLRTVGGRLACIAGSPTKAPAVVLIDPVDAGVQVLRSSEEAELDPGYLTVPEPIEFPAEGGRTAYALHYPPANAAFQGPAGERPPLVVASHGGPTAGVTSDLHLSYQYFTSRGVAVVDVDYGG
jgi:dipeptidyl aminopeptidase/acylaminoacyl peptidase